MDSQEALIKLQIRLQRLVDNQCPQLFTNDSADGEIAGIEYSISLLEQVVEHDEEEALNHLADMVAHEYYSSQED